MHHHSFRPLIFNSDGVDDIHFIHMEMIQSTSNSRALFLPVHIHTPTVYGQQGSGPKKENKSDSSLFGHYTCLVVLTDNQSHMHTNADM